MKILAVSAIAVSVLGFANIAQAQNATGTQDPPHRLGVLLGEVFPARVVDGTPELGDVHVAARPPRVEAVEDAQNLCRAEESAHRGLRHELFGLATTRPLRAAAEPRAGIGA